VVLSCGCIYNLSVCADVMSVRYVKTIQVMFAVGYFKTYVPKCIDVLCPSKRSNVIQTHLDFFVFPYCCSLAYKTGHKTYFYTRIYPGPLAMNNF
jgi:hypothetical protein